MPQSRLLSLDVFRGITIAAMILVNNPGSWGHVYPPLRHAKWHGWTPTDLIFPFFLFIVGISISLSLSKRREQGDSFSKIVVKIVRRTLILFGLGLLIHLLYHLDFQHIRIPGVLQRIAVCYFFASMLFIKSGYKGRAAAGFFLLAGYWLLIKLVPVPGFGAGDLSLEGNLCAYIDVKLLAGHLYKPAFDPEGVLSTLPAIATVLLGTLTGDWLRSSFRPFVKLQGLFAAGFVMTAFGLILHPVFPINKQLWTSTFVIFTAGVGLLVLGICYWLLDLLNIKKGTYPFLVYGANAIALYVGSGVLGWFLSLFKVKAFVYSNLLAPWAGPKLGSLLYPVLLLLIWLVLLSVLYRRRIFIRI